MAAVELKTLVNIDSLYTEPCVITVCARCEHCVQNKKMTL